MKRSLATLGIPAALGFLLMVPIEAMAYCCHGFPDCRTCSVTYGYGYGTASPAPSPAGGAVAQPAPNGGAAAQPAPGAANNAAGTSAPPAAPALPAGTLPYPGAYMGAAAPAVAQAAYPAYSYQSPQYPAYPAYWYQSPQYPAYPAYSYQSPQYSAYPAYAGSPYVPGLQAPAAPAPGSYLDGYSDAAAIFPVSPGTRLVSGQLFGSQIFQVLQRFGTGLNRSGLVDLAIRGFFDASGFMPSPTEREIIERIVTRFLRSGGTPAPDAGPGQGPGQAVDTPPGGTATLRFIVTVQITPDGRVGDVQTQPAGQTQGQAPGVQNRENGSQSSQPPTAPAPAPPVTSPPATEKPATTTPPAPPVPGRASS